MWNLLNNNNKKHNSNRLIDMEKRLTVVTGEEVWGGWVKKVKGYSKKAPKTHRHRQHHGYYQREGGR